LSADPVLVAVVSGKQELAEGFLRAAQALAPDLPLFTISEFQPPLGKWLPYRVERPMADNLAAARAEMTGRRVRFCAVLLDPNTPYDPMRWMAFRLAPLRGVYFNESLNHFMLRPRSAATIVRHFLWRLGNWIRFEVNPGGRLYRWMWRMRRPSRFRWPILHGQVLSAPTKALERPPLPPPEVLPPGITVVIPSRQGRALLERCLPLVLAQGPEQVIVVDNGSTDGTGTSLPPGVECLVSSEPLSFSAAVNRGIAAARFSHVCLLNNDMEIEPGFFQALRAAFAEVPDLFCATAQIFFPEGMRREETGKAILPAHRDPDAIVPLRCETPVEGENLSPVLYGSGGCSLYDTARIRQLGLFDESFTPAYVEDLDVGLRGWDRGWPTVYVGEARVLHRHRSTTSRYFTAAQIDLAIRRNWMRCLAKNGQAKLWKETAAKMMGEPFLPLLEFCSTLDPRTGGVSLDAGSGDIAAFQGNLRRGRPVVVVVSCYPPFPLAHGGAVRMYNLMARAAREYDQVLLYFVDAHSTPPPELLDICAEVVQIRRHPTHIFPQLMLPDVVQEFQSGACRAAIDLAIRRWKPFALQLEFTQLAQYARPDVASILVEHDITLDLYRQLRDTADGARRWEFDRQLRLWDAFERRAWREVTRVVVMSERDRATAGAHAILVPNGVDTERFQPSADPPQPGRLLFIGSFNHLPNILAAKQLAEQILPRVQSAWSLHLIAGNRHDYFLDFYRDRADLRLQDPRIEVEGFVSDVRPAYRGASVVVAPLVASAGTNIKILEAMAMGKPIVSTPAGVHGLDVTDGLDVLIRETPADFAKALDLLLGDVEFAAHLGRNARQTVLARYGWDRIAAIQDQLYRSLRAATQ
jgi:glycosyltransferase involved in cell wall biosynthesis/GT2 family glycosyltransferase